MSSKTLCIADTCSLIYLSDIELMKKPLYSWLFNEFDVAYSDFVWNKELKPQLGRLTDKIRKKLTRGGVNKPRLVNQSQEEALFGSFYRMEYVGVCSRCSQPISKHKLVNINLQSDTDRGERHNCVIALDTVRSGEHRQVIYLTDDYKAARNYVHPIFEIFPLGNVWSSYDFVLYLFVRYYFLRIHIDDIKKSLRDITAKALGSAKAQGISKKTELIWQKRFITYSQKVDRIDQVMQKFP